MKFSIAIIQREDGRYVIADQHDHSIILDDCDGHGFAIKCLRQFGKR